MGRISYEISHTAAVTLYSNSSHETEHPEVLFRSLVRKQVGCPTALVIDLLSQSYQSTSGNHRAGDPLFTVALYPGDVEYVLIADVEDGTVVRREVAPVGLAQLPTSFEACVTAFFGKARAGGAIALSFSQQIAASAERVTRAIAECDDDELIVSAASLNLELTALLGSKYTGLLDASREAFIELQSNSRLSAPAPCTSETGTLHRWMPGSEVRLGEYEFGILFRDEGTTLQVLIEEGMLVTWPRNKGGQSVQVTHVMPSSDEVQMHCRKAVPYRGFKCTAFGEGQALFSDGEIEARYCVSVHEHWELEAWAGVKIEIDRHFMH